MNFPDSLNSFKAFLISSILADDVPIVESSKNIPEILGSIAAALILLMMSLKAEALLQVTSCNSNRRLLS